MDFKINIDDLPLEALILIAASKREINVTVSNETCLTVNNNIRFTSKISVVRYLANIDTSHKWMGINALERCEINHWITYTIGSLIDNDNFEEGLNYLDRATAPVTYLVGNRCTLADVVLWSRLFNLPKWIDLLESQNSPTNVTRWYSFIASLDFIKAALNHVGRLTKTSIKKGEDLPIGVSISTVRKEEGKFVDLPEAEMGKVVVRFPPEASGYLHIGHAKAVLLNQYYKEAFNGQLIMRFDDTNPAKEKENFEKVILEDLKLLKINYDKLTRTSNYFDLMLEMCEKLLKEGKAYIDNTNAEEMKKEREQKICSINRNNSVDKNMSMWLEMKNGTEKGQMCCVRAKIDMSSLNGCMRDPTIYRCKNEPHPQTGYKYKVYPTYDFACPIVDSLEGVTHCLRTMEYHDRDEQFYWFIEALGLRKPYIWEYSRLNMTNTVLSKRKLTWFVDNNYVEDWDDPRMPTVRGILRRGMTVEGLKQFIIAQGSSRSVVLMEWDKIWAINKKIIDPVAARYTAVEAVKNIPVTVLNVEETSTQVAKHPKNKEVGEKTIWISSRLLVDEADANQFKEGENVTFINWGNLTIKDIKKENGKIKEVIAIPNIEDRNYKKTLKVTWLADTKMAPLIPVLCLYFDHIISKPILGKDEDFKQYIDHKTMFKLEMLGEPELASVNKSDIIELQRKGFFICDRTYMPSSIYNFQTNPLVLIYIPDGHNKGLPTGLAEEKRTSPTIYRNITDLTDHLNLQLQIVNKMLIRKECGEKFDLELNKLNSLKEKYSKVNSVRNVLENISVIENKLKQLTTDKSDNSEIRKYEKALSGLKNSFKTITGQTWKAGLSDCEIFQIMGISTSTLVDSLKLSLKITEIGNKIRKLKTDKAGKAEIDDEVKCLLDLKTEYKSLTGSEWKPDSGTKVKIAGCFNENMCKEKISEVENKIRKLKSEKADKNLIDEQLKILLELKENLEVFGRVEWSPNKNLANSENEAKFCNSSSISDNIKSQGDKIRELKAKKADKAAIDAEVKVLLALKADFKNSAGKEWTPDIAVQIQKIKSNPISLGSDASSSKVKKNKSDVPTADSEFFKLLNKIKDQGDKIRELKVKKADKATVDTEVKFLLGLKTDFKNTTGKDWTPDIIEQIQKTKTNVSILGTDSSSLSRKIKTQGDKVRELKGNKADKTIIDAEIKVLLALKADFQSSTGKEWNPNVTEKGQKTNSEAESNTDVNNITNKIKDQGNVVRMMKSNNAEKDQLNDAIQKLLTLKTEYKKLTGQDFPSDNKNQSSKKSKSNVDDANKKIIQKEKTTKQERKVESEGTLKKITRLGLEAKKEENLSDWYSQIIVKSELIEYYDISGCYILRPWSFAIWEIIKDWFDKEIKLLGVKNCYFPIFVSKAVLEKEKTHIQGFAPEVAWVTKSGDSDLAEPIAVRPTSETVMYPAYAKWIQSYRDLPIKLNQWNNVVRWEFKHPQPFLRTREFLWQEGHTAYASFKEAEEEVYTILELYAAVYTDLLAVPVVKGRKTEKEKFAGSGFTLTVEAYISASGRAIQGATSHHLGQNFSKMFEIIYEDPETQEKKYVYQNSWGITTRTVGVLIMVHADNQGLVLPPKVACVQVIIVPCGITVSMKEEDRNKLLDVCSNIHGQLQKNDVRCEVDIRDNYSPGWKFNHWELKGVPIRIEIGPKDIQQEQIMAVRRDTGQKITIPMNTATNQIKSLLEAIQKNLLTRAEAELKEHMILCKDWTIFCEQLEKKNILLSPFCGQIECEDKIKEDSTRNDQDVDIKAPSMGAKSLCIPFDQPEDITAEHKCINPSCNAKPKFYCLFGRSY